MEDKTYKTLKGELNSAFSDEYIKNAGLLIYQMADNFYHEQNLEQKAYFDFLWHPTQRIYLPK